MAHNAKHKSEAADEHLKGSGSTNIAPGDKAKTAAGALGSGGARKAATAIMTRAEKIAAAVGDQ